MRKKGIFLTISGILGIVFVCTFDIIAGKPVNDITGPKSISALIVFGITLLFGLIQLFRGLRKKWVFWNR
jgi:hypothetical protein